MPIRKDSISGFSLIEVMLAMGLLALAMTALMQIGSQGMASAKNVTTTSDFNILVSNLQVGLSSVCSNILQGNTFTVDSTTPVPILNPMAVPNPNPTYSFAAIGETLGGIQVSSLSLNQKPIPVFTAVNGNVEYQTNLNVQARSIATSPGGIPTHVFNKDFPVMIWVNPGTNQIVQCQGTNTPQGASLTVTPGSCQANFSWTLSNPGAIVSAQLVQANPPGSTYELGPTPSASTLPITTSGTYTFILMVTDSSGVQSYGNPSATQGTQTVAISCP